MSDLEILFSNNKVHGDNPLCEGCSILNKIKPCHSVMDYKDKGTSDVLFLSDSLKYMRASREAVAFGKKELDLIKQYYKEDFETAAAIKCPGVKDADFSPSDMKLCRVHLEATIDKIKPKLVFPCGNLSMKMLIKKSGITSKRGKSFDYVTEAGHECKVVPLLHPFACILEPANLFLFEKDISNAYEKYILNKTSKGTFHYNVMMNIEDVEEAAEYLSTTDEDTGVDIETTGLNFLTDSIMTLSISTREDTWVFPVDHKDSPFRVGEPHHDRLVEALRNMMSNPNNRKVFHNCKFDIKFLLNYDIPVAKVWDTKIMYRFIDENVPNGLMDLIKLYFSSELENL